jgi:hypothetical protein
MPGFFVKIAVSVIFSPVCPGSAVLPISTSWVAGITDLNHCHQLNTMYFQEKTVSLKSLLTSKDVKGLGTPS